MAWIIFIELYKKKMLSFITIKSNGKLKMVKVHMKMDCDVIKEVIAKVSQSITF